MPLVHYDVMRKPLPWVEGAALHHIRPITHESFAVPLVPQRTQPLGLAPMHVACVLRPRVTPRVEENTEATIAGLTAPLARRRRPHGPIACLRCRASSAQTFLRGETGPGRIGLPVISDPPRLRPRIADELGRLGQRVIITVAREPGRKSSRLLVCTRFATRLTLAATLARRVSARPRRVRRSTLPLRSRRLPHVALVPPDHLALRPFQEHLVPFKPLRLQRRKHLPIERIRALVLLNNPSGHPLFKHRVRKHLHERETPAVVPADLELHKQVTYTQVARIIGHSGACKWIHKLCRPENHGRNRFHRRLHLIPYQRVPPLRRHVPPIRDHGRTRVALMNSMLHVRAICTETRGDHQANGPRAPAHASLIHGVLPPELIEGQVPDLFLRHRGDALGHLLAHEAQALIKLIDAAIIVHGGVVVSVLHRRRGLQGARARRVQADDRHQRDHERQLQPQVHGLIRMEVAFPQRSGEELLDGAPQEVRALAFRNILADLIHRVLQHLGQST